MSVYKKESLEKLLVLIDEISAREENDWFKEELQKKYGVLNGNSVHNNSSSSSFNLQINNIEKYLKLDGYTVIDYSAIANETVRDQLFRDCIEMSKYRLGKINDIINFDEYCRYAHLQAEELINYYYTERFYGNLNFVGDFIKIHLPTYDNSKKVFSLNQISYFYKLTAFLIGNELTKGKMKETLEFLIDLRNEMSHRNSLEVKEEDEVLLKLKSKGYKIATNFIDFNSTSKNDQRLFKKGRFIYLKRQQDYDQILESLNYLKDAVILLLKIK